MTRIDVPTSNAASWLLVATIAFVPLGSMPVNVLSIAALIALLCAGGWLTRLQHIWDCHLTRWAITLLACVGLSILWTEAPASECIRALTKYARLLYIPLAITLLPARQWRTRALIAFAAAATITLAFSYLHLIYPFHWARASRLNIEFSHNVFKSYITQGVMLSFFTVICLVFGRYPKQKNSLQRPNFIGQLSPKIWFGLALASSLNICLLLLGRTGQITLAISLTVFGLLALNGKVRAAFFLIIVALIAAMLFSSSKFRERLHSVSTELTQYEQTGVATSSAERLAFANAALKIALARPLTGFGLASYPHQFCEVIEPQVWCAKGIYRPHNQFLLFAAEQGLPGMLIFCALLISALHAARRIDKPRQILMVCLVLTCATHSMLDSTLFIANEGVFYPLFIGVLASFSDRKYWSTNRI